MMGYRKAYGNGDPGGKRVPQAVPLRVSLRARGYGKPHPYRQVGERDVGVGLALPFGGSYKLMRVRQAVPLRAGSTT